MRVVSIKRVIGYPTSAFCYWHGHAVSRVMGNRMACVLYPIYNQLMRWSVAVEDWAGIEYLWRKAK